MTKKNKNKKPNQELSGHRFVYLKEYRGSVLGTPGLPSSPVHIKYERVIPWTVGLVEIP